MAEQQKTMDVLMLRETLGEVADEDGNLNKMEVGTVQTVTVKFGRWLIWKQKARALTEADAKKAEVKGPISEKDLPGAKK